MSRRSKEKHRYEEEAVNNQQRMRCKDVAERWRRRFLIESSHVRKVFWGTQGVRAAYLRQKFQPFMETCDMFIDEEPSLQGQMINGLFVCMPESLKDIREKIVIIVLSEDYAKVRGMLRDYGYVENVDFVEGRHLLGEDENGYIEVPYVEKNDGSMIVYGQGAHLADMLKWHPELANCISRVIDKDHRKIGALISELNVIIEPPEVLKDLPNGTEVVISAIEHIEEIKTEIYSYQPELICWDIDTAWQEMFLGNANDAYDVSLLNQKKYIGILTTKHCLYIAELLKDNISARGFDCEIFIDDDKMNLESEDLYIVICPQMYKCLPKNYIAFQLEQSVSSRWFNDEYIARLKKSIAIFEYSLTNIEYLQTQGIPFGKIFYMPISPKDKIENKENHKYEYDVLFYGDVHSDRREKFLDKIQEKFDVKIISNLFAEELKRELGKAKIVLNIHFYEGAVLETTRLSEVLSIGRSLIISERSSEENLDNQFKDCVDFVEVNDVDKMIERIGFWLSDSDRLKRKVKSVNNNRKNIFTFFFNRFLLAKNLISFDDFYNNTAGCFDFAGKKICLNLPESVDRRRYFDSINRYGFQYFPGLRHDIGWIGCGLSYKFIIRKAKEDRLDMISVCEDDVVFGERFQKQYDLVLQFLNANKNKWDVFSGFLAETDGANVNAIEKFEGKELIFIDRMVSTVFNIYNNSIFDRFLQWDDKIRSTDNTIDRFLQNKELKIITMLPFLVGHNEKLFSTLWGASNDIYIPLIEKSIKQLKRKISAYKNDKMRFDLICK